MLLLLPLLSALAHAAETEGTAPGVLLWMTPGPPGAEIAGRATRLTDGAAPYAWGEFAFARGEETEVDRSRLLAVSTAIETAHKRWNDFDVEEGIAQQLNTAVDGVEILRNDEDRAAVVNALLVSGLASQRAFPESRFAILEAASPFRAMVAARAVQKAWLDALALEPSGTWTRKEVDDGPGLGALLALKNDLDALPRAKMSLPPRPKGVTLYVDGRAQADDVTSLDLYPGRHYLHAMVGQRLAGRTEVTLEAGQVTAFPMAVDEAALREAGRKVVAGDLALPDPVMQALSYYRVVGGRPARVFLGALDEKGNPEIVPFAGGAVLVHPKPFSALLVGDLGGGLVSSEGFTNASSGQPVKTAAFGPNLGMQFGVYNAMLLGGAQLYITPGSAMEWNATGSDPTPAPVYVRPYVGAGVYLPRPTNHLPLFQLAVTYGWFLPGSSGIGGTFAAGIPVRQEGTWVRLSADVYAGTQGPGQPGEGTRTMAAVGRIGFARKM